MTSPTPIPDASLTLAESGIVKDSPLTQAGTLGDLYLLIRVIEAGGFSAAARRTGIARSLLSRRIIELERRFGVRLLERSTRSFAMTAVGEQVYRHALAMMDAAQAAERVALEALGEAMGPLRLGVPALLHELMPSLLRDFVASHPKVRLSLLAQGESTGLTQDLDLALQLDEPPRAGSRVVAHALARLRFVTVASPSLLRQLGPLRHPDELEDRHCLGFGTPQALRPWPLRQARPRPLRDSALSSDSLPMLLTAVRAGQGVAHLPLFACAEDIRSGRLAILFEAHEAEPVTLYALSPPRPGITQAMRSLVQTLRERLDSGEIPGVLQAADPARPAASRRPLATERTP